MVLEYDHGVQGVMSHATSLGRQGDFLVIHGTLAALHVSDSELRIVDGDSGESRSVPVSGTAETDAMWDEVARVIGDGAEPRYSLPAALSDLAFMEAVSASLHQDRRMVIG